MKKCFMKKSAHPIVVAIITLASLSSLIASCSKKSSSDNTPTTNSFTWNYNGTKYTATLDSAYEFSYPGSQHYVVAIIGSNFQTSFTKRIAFNLPSFNAGTYTISTSGNKFLYAENNGLDEFGNSGTITIGAYQNNKLSGSFSCNFPGSVVITGSFTNVPVCP